MRIHHFQHVPFEGLGSMEAYFRTKGHELSATHLYRTQTPPPLDKVDWLVVMGGPMGVGDESRLPWMAMEKSYIGKAIDAGKVVLGICLGAQLIADVLGDAVYKNPYREIGWFPVQRSEQAAGTPLGSVLPTGQMVFHWHGDTFDIPDRATLLASSEACRNQGFVIENRVVGLQFHLETTPASARALVDNCGDELDDGPYVQTAMQIMADPAKFDGINNVMANLLDKIVDCNP